jgi:hypothetical protein
MQIAGHELLISELESRRNSLETRLRQVTKTSEAYLKIRRRFIEVYKRYHKGVKDLHPSKGWQLSSPVRSDRLRTFYLAIEESSN